MYAYPTISVPKLHTEYTAWMEELFFYKEEIKIFEQHLGRLTAKNREHQIVAQVEHFQNVFIRHKEVIDTIRHNLHISEKQLTVFVKNMSGMGLSSIKMDNHTSLRDEIQTFRKLFNELKYDFRRFELQCRRCPERA
jgi:hypothetical protein